MKATTGNENDRVVIFDTTLRDGEQCPGATMTHEEKIEVAELLDMMGVDIIEAGFPVASEGDFQAVHEIAKRTHNAVVCGLARANDKDIMRAGEALKPAKRGRIHTFIATSPVHMKKKLAMNEGQVLDAIVRSVKLARNYTDDVEWSCEDGTRSHPEFLKRCIETAIRAGATTINVPDTVGYSAPEEYFGLLKMLRESVPGAERVRFSTHCHDDLGLAVSNSLSGVRAGARQVECTINGIGERAGNAALEEIVMAMRVRNDIFPYWTAVNTAMLARASKLVSRATSFPVPFNKAIVGRNAFAHESGIHQDGMIKDSTTYEIMRPEDVGARKSVLVMGKHSGRNAFKEKLGELGYADLSENQFEDAFVRFKALCDRMKYVSDEDIEALVDEKIASQSERVTLVSMTAVASTHGVHPAALELSIDGGKPRSVAGKGNGPVNSVFDAIAQLVPHDAVVEDYQVHSIKGSGSESQADVMVQLSIKGRSITAKAADPDTLVASAKAYLHALNKFIARGMVVIPEEVATGK